MFSRLFSSLSKYRHRVRWLPAFLGVFTLSAACLLGWLSFALVRQLTIQSQLAGSVQAPVVASSTTASGSPLGGGSTPQPTPAALQPEPTLTPWDGVGRVTILLLGLDYRDWEAGGEASRSDTMILLSLDPLSHTAGILSIPRDMWVPIPGFKHGKINTAYYLGDAYKMPGGGPGLAVKTVEQFLGVPINYYAQVDFGAFVKFIDELGGVKINVTEPITIDLLGGGARTKKKLQPGVQVLPGEWALAYARARNTEGGDFDRARRQQQVILAIRDRILSFNMLPTLIAKADVLYAQLASGIRTNLPLDQAIKLALLASQVPDDHIRRGVIDQKYVLFGRSPDNLAILIPIYDKIQLLRDEIFADTTALGPLTPGNAQQSMQAEAARVAIYNASGRPNLGAQTVQYLQGQGLQVVASGDAGDVVTLTRLIDHTGKPFTNRYLVDLLGVSAQEIEYAYDPHASADVEVILGRDWAQKSPFK